MSLALECFKNTNRENDLSVLASVSRTFALRFRPPFSHSDTTWRCSGKCEGESRTGADGVRRGAA